MDSQRAAEEAAAAAPGRNRKRLRVVAAAAGAAVLSAVAAAGWWGLQPDPARSKGRRAVASAAPGIGVSPSHMTPSRSSAQTSADPTYATVIDGSR
mgnify:CR=1 FL=1